MGSANPISRAGLEAVHSPDYVAEVYRVCSELDATESEEASWLSGDSEVLVSAGSLNAIVHAAGAAQQAVRMVLDPTQPVKRVFCNVRPPGHHAHFSKGQGFCIFNNIWIAACEARKLGAQRVAIIDWDVHHGNGTQDFIIGHPEEENTLFFSIHQHHATIWPGTGEEEGSYGDAVHCGEMRPGSGDVDMERYFDGVLLPRLRTFRPDIILISCGFDGHVEDEIAGLCYSTELYGWMTDRLVEVANESCDGRIVSVLEGGYCVSALMDSALMHVRALLQN